MKNILINGLLAGGVSMIVALVFHFVNPSLNFDFSTSIIINTVIYLFFLIRAGFQQRKRLGGFLGFGEVFVPSIGIYAIASFMAVTFMFIMMKLNPELVELMKESSKSVSESMLSMAGMSEEQIALAIEEANEVEDPNRALSLTAQISGWLGGIIIFGLPYALIASLITKKKDKSIA